MICAVNVSAAPLQIVVAVELIVIVGVCVATVIVIELDVAVDGDAHEELEVMTHDTIWPLVSVVVV